MYFFSTISFCLLLWVDKTVEYHLSVFNRRLRRDSKPIKAMIKKFLVKQIKQSAVGKQMYEAIYGKDHSLNASFGKASSLISSDGDGFCIDGTRFISLAKSRENYLVIAPSGRGKSQVSVFPFLLNAKGKSSLIINDPSGELSNTIPYLESVGYQCEILDFAKNTLGNILLAPGNIIANLSFRKAQVIFGDPIPDWT